MAIGQNMNQPLRIALLGAGFTRNWGGWLATELVGELCGRVGDDEHLRRRLKETRNFEHVLGEFRQEANCGAPELARFELLQRAVLETFEDMNRMLAAAAFEFNVRHEQCWVAHFLASFDALFTLNQDLLLEMHYTPGALPEGRRRWQGTCYPGMLLPAEWTTTTRGERLGQILTPALTEAPNTDLQPIYKLHGSVNWRAENGSPIVVIGDGKQESIHANQVLSNSFARFQECLSAGKTKLMVIGYGFADEHVNALLTGASLRDGLETYLVNPAGLSLFDPSPKAAIEKRSDIYQALRPVGIATRPFRDAFVSDELTFNSFQRFLQHFP